MRTLKWTLIIGFWTLVAAFFHYTLPQKDIVYIQGTEIELRNIAGVEAWFYASAEDGNANAGGGRDLRLINATRANGEVIVYRNEDTGFGWPPYFKINSSDLQAEAQNAISTRGEPEWYLMTHYGWRLNFPTLYPNAIGLTPIAGPDAGKPLPWLNILILLSIAALWYTIWVRWRRWRSRTIDPKLEEWQDDIDHYTDWSWFRRSRDEK